MVHPKNANPQNFSVGEILYNLNGFSIAWGTWEDDGLRRLAMRWNGDNDEDAGYPKTFGNPMWFMLPHELSLPISQIISGFTLIHRS